MEIFPKRPLIPIYSTRGDVEAFLVYPYVYSRYGEWIGWISPERVIYSVHGNYVGWLSEDRRILRKQEDGYGRERIEILPPPKLMIPMPANTPLAPLMAELKIGIIDVLADAPELLPPIDFGELHQDMV
jgi:hypothetical protein